MTSTFIARQMVANEWMEEQMEKEKINRYGYCKVCGSRMKLYKMVRKNIEYNTFTGEPIYYDELIMCSADPCHTFHTWYKPDTIGFKILDILYKSVHLGIGDVEKCEMCGKKRTTSGI